MKTEPVRPENSIKGSDKKGVYNPYPFEDWFERTNFKAADSDISGF